MSAAQGSGPDPTLLDALAGSGGTSDPIQPVDLGFSPVGDVFPDALSASPMPFPFGQPAPEVLSTGSPDALRQVRAAAPVARRPPPSPRPPPNLRPPSGIPGPPRPWSQFPPPGQPAVEYLPVPTSAQLAPASGRRPTAGTGSPVAGRTGPAAGRPVPTGGRPAPTGGRPAPTGGRPVPTAGRTGPAAGRTIPAVVRNAPAAGRDGRSGLPAGAPFRSGADRAGLTRPGTPVRPPAYLPPPGLAGIRAALQQARRDAGPRKDQTSGPRASLSALAMTLVPGGLGRRLSSAVSHLRQRR